MRLADSCVEGVLEDTGLMCVVVGEVHVCANRGVGCYPMGRPCDLKERLIERKLYIACYKRSKLCISACEELLASDNFKVL